jgi:peroxiredoxin
MITLNTFKRVVMKKWLMLALSLMAGGLAAGSEELLTPIQGRPQAPDFVLKDVSGQTHRLADYRGKVVVVNFWATWCPPCVLEMPSMQKAWEATRNNNVVILAINNGEDAKRVQAFHRKSNLTFPLLLDTNANIMAEWKARGMPSTFVVDPEGRLVYQALGGRDWNHPTILRVLRSLFKHSAPDTMKS